MKEDMILNIKYHQHVLTSKTKDSNSQIKYHKFLYDQRFKHLVKVKTKLKVLKTQQKDTEKMMDFKFMILIK